jgi:hypothetical protein
MTNDLPSVGETWYHMMLACAFAVSVDSSTGFCACVCVIFIGVASGKYYVESVADK